MSDSNEGRKKNKTNELSTPPQEERKTKQMSLAPHHKINQICSRTLLMEKERGWEKNLEREPEIQ
jgi:hypothetical protein